MDKRPAIFKALSERRTLWLLLFTTILLTFLFQWLSSHWDLVFIDSMTSPTDARQYLTVLSPEQITVHIWTTAVVDVAYPLAYGGFFAGSALCFFPRFGVYLALPSLLVIPVDLLEGVVQVLALAEIKDWLDWKAFLTPLKFLLFFVGLGITVAGWCAWAIRRLRQVG